MKSVKFHLLGASALLLLTVSLGGFICGQAQRQSAVALGSSTAKNGFRNETEIAAKFNNWKTDEDARMWLAKMNFTPADIENVLATKPHGEKADVQLKIRTKEGEFTEGISIKLVSNPVGFNQIDKRRLTQYARMWEMPRDVATALKLFVGETKPYKASRTPKRMFLNEFEAEMQRKVVEFFRAKKGEIVDDLFRGDGPFAARWFLVALKGTEKPRWILRSTTDAAKFFSEGDVTITRNGNLRIGRITMQRKGGDGGRETANMLQFKINPALLLRAQ